MKKQESQRKTYKVRTSLNYIPTEGKTPSGISKTIPSQAYSLAELMARYARNMPVNVNVKTTLYEDPTNPSYGIDPKTLDLAELEQLQILNNQEIEKLKQNSISEHNANSSKRRELYLKRLQDKESQISEIITKKLAEKGK